MKGTHVLLFLTVLLAVGSIEYNDGKQNHGVMKLNPQLINLLNKYRIHHNVTQVINDPSLPTNFDGRVQWPGCIHPVLDQGACGSCWAFAASEVLSDRFCIFSNKQINVVLSPQNLLSCEDENIGCSLGSLPNFAWEYLTNYGIVTMDCVPYVSGSGSVPSCTYNQKQCTSPNQSWKLFKSANYTQVGSTIEPSLYVQEIMKAVMQGPVDVTFDVWSDFDNYQGGVYEHKSGTYGGLHSVKIIGWGVENGVDYWLVQNSWGTSWGLNGYFKIRRGVDECFIESLVYTGIPAL